MRQIFLALAVMMGGTLTAGLTVAPIGAPQVPEEVRIVDVPAGKRCTGVTVTVKGWRDGGVTDYPPVPAPVCEPGAARTPRDAAYYSLATWPAAPYRVMDPVRRRGREQVAVKLYPHRWHPTTGKLEIATGFELEPQFEDVPKPARLQAVLPKSSADYVVISPHDLVAGWQTYVDHRHQRFPSLTFSVKDAAEIYRDYPYAPNTARRNPAESIHAYIKDAVAAGAKYIVLGGPWWIEDAEEDGTTLADGTPVTLGNSIPGIKVRPHYQVANLSQYDRDVASDLFYACLDDYGKSGVAYPWDADGNGMYLAGASEQALCDLVPDVVVARIPLQPWDGDAGAAVKSQLQILADFTAKLDRGEAATFDGYGRVNWTCSALGANSGHDWDRYRNASDLPRDELCFYDSVPNFYSAAHTDRSADIEYTLRRLLKDKYATYRPIRSMTAVAGDDYYKSRNWSTRYADNATAIAALFNTDCELFIPEAHGSEVAASEVTAARFWAGNALALVIAAHDPCLTGRPDYMKNNQLLPCMGAAEICSPNGGALAAVHNANNGWFTDDGKVSRTFIDGYSAELMENYVYYLGGEGYNAGEAWRESISDYVTMHSPRSTQLWCCTEQILYGDPLVALPSVRNGAATIANGSWNSADTQASFTLAINPDGNGKAVLQGAGELRAMRGATTTANEVMISCGGGFGTGLSFASAGGTLKLAGESPFYLGGVANCAKITVSGGNKTIDLDGFDATARKTLEFTGGMGPNHLRSSAAAGMTNVSTFTLGDTELHVEMDTLAFAIMVLNETRLVFAPSPNYGISKGCAFKPNVVQVNGHCSLTTIEGWSLCPARTLNFTVMPAAILDFDAKFDSSVKGNLRFSNGGEVNLTSLPLVNVTNVVLQTQGTTLRLPQKNRMVYQLFDGPAKLTLGTGTKIVDSDGRELHGTLTETGAYIVDNADVAAFLEEEALFRLDASRRDSLDLNGTTVTAWRDISKGGRQVTVQKSPVYGEDDSGPYVDFGASKAKNKGNDLAYPVVAGKTFVWVVEMLNGYNAYLLGNTTPYSDGRTGTDSFYRGQTKDEGFNSFYFNSDYYCAAGGCTNLVFRRNGKRIYNAGTTGLPTDLGIITATFDMTLLTDHLCQSQAGSGYSGGKKLRELVVFERELSLAELQLIERHLSEKWRCGFSSPAPEAPAIVRNEASFWLDANTVAQGHPANDYFSSWRDVRGEGYPEAKVYSNYFSPQFIKIGEPALTNRATVSFRAQGTRCDMNFTRLPIRTAFFVASLEQHQYAWLLGDTTDYAFHRGTGGTYQYSHNNVNGCTYWNNGVQVSSPLTTLIPTGFQLITWTHPNEKYVSQMTQDRAIAGRCGGKCLSEMVLFNRQLSAAERQVVEDYLRAKWFGGQPKVDGVATSASALPSRMKSANTLNLPEDWRIVGNTLVDRQREAQCAFADYYTAMLTGADWRFQLNDKALPWLVDAKLEAGNFTVDAEGGRTGLKYQLLDAPAVEGPWSDPGATWVPGTDNQPLHLTRPATDQQRFYRIKVSD